MAHYVLVVGASGGIGTAVCRAYAERASTARVVAISRTGLDFDHPKVRALSCDHQPGSIRALVEAHPAWFRQLTRVVICNGQLHSDDFQPEKRIEQLDSEAMMMLFQINTVTPMLYLKALLPCLPPDNTFRREKLAASLHSQPRIVVTVLSARVGSITDNRAGGWYSYRASKAALNMALKTAAIEWWRRNSAVKLLAFHPGTTNTPLSQPYQSRVPPAKLFSTDFVAQKLIAQMDRALPDGALSFVDWAGCDIDW
ncbi:SDR family NAD(P)-dependent oxidoreductase [Ferrimonas pelagia]|uniref:SDR family NAD(P)-dependent oxidoreductase n=1 Tax=Ferrimonas pelagia TaxID=1177826 RepID=A0ABP9FNQ6_9GAMM